MSLLGEQYAEGVASAGDPGSAAHVDAAANLSFTGGEGHIPTREELDAMRRQAEALEYEARILHARQSIATVRRTFHDMEQSCSTQAQLQGVDVGSMIAGVPTPTRSLPTSADYTRTGAGSVLEISPEMKERMKTPRSESTSSLLHVQSQSNAVTPGGPARKSMTSMIRSSIRSGSQENLEVLAKAFLSPSTEVSKMRMEIGKPLRCAYGLQ